MASEDDAPVAKRRRPRILFTRRMVQAVIDGEKSQTVLLMSPQPRSDDDLPEPPYNPGDRVRLRKHWDDWYRDTDEPDSEEPADKGEWGTSYEIPDWMLGVIGKPPPVLRPNLEISDIRAERLNDVNVEILISDGLIGADREATIDEPPYSGVSNEDPSPIVRAVKDVLDTASRANPNPFVWVITFRVVT